MNANTAPAMNEMHYAAAVCAAINGNQRPAPAPAWDASVRVIDRDGAVLHCTEWPDDMAAWDAFTALVPALRPGHTAQLIVDDAYAAEHSADDDDPTVHSADYYV